MSCLKYWDVNNFYGLAISQKPSINEFNLVEDLFEFNKDVIKSYNEKSNEGCFLEVDIHYPEDLH